eukprot:CAMPEP_0119564000 /NCGR_PEP_ID=MMETSP1352-20130426/25475_1 /TAXON_ID=265584 /ORGANISM="Stauroneis constricta, Strain CCMP1120" /LENGTH=507 /DNA_ID=CAMNT_0007612697 /DNA_START=1410 /DNA_END=2933 /DNA_ORIENTATION=-
MVPPLGRHDQHTQRLDQGQGRRNCRQEHESSSPYRKGGVALQRAGSHTVAAPFLMEDVQAAKTPSRKRRHDGNVSSAVAAAMSIVLQGRGQGVGGMKISSQHEDNANCDGGDGHHPSPPKKKARSSSSPSSCWQKLEHVPRHSAGGAIATTTTAPPDANTVVGEAPQEGTSSQKRERNHDIFVGYTSSPSSFSARQDHRPTTTASFTATASFSSTATAKRNRKSSPSKRNEDDQSSSKSSSTTTTTEDAEGKSPEERFRGHQANQWERRYAELVEFHAQHGHCLVARSIYDDSPKLSKLAHWIKWQRQQFKRKLQGHDSTLSDERQRKLDALGFVWGAQQAIWEERYNELLQFFNVHGHSHVTPTNNPFNGPLTTWVKSQRKQYRKHLKILEQEHQEEEQPPQTKTTTHAKEEKKRPSSSSRCSGRRTQRALRSSPVSSSSTSFEDRYVPSSCSPMIATRVLSSSAVGNGMCQDRIDRLNALNFVWQPSEQKKSMRARQSLEIEEEE